MAVALLISSSPALTAEETYYLADRIVSTRDKGAQEQFNRGLTFFYAFNRQAAAAAFRRATSLDPKLALAWWGVALALGPNLNVEMTKDEMLAALQAIGKAKSLEDAASAEDRALIDALATRYRPNGDQHQLAVSYAVAMQRLAGAYPDDPDVQALYLESVLDLLQLHGEVKGITTWASGAKVAIIDAARWPNHIGILHYFIHLTEPDSGSMAVDVANTLASYSFAPQASHLIHMPSHVYVYVGQWSKVAACNRRAVQMDVVQAKEAGIDPSRLDYFFHNLDFWYGGAIMSGDEASARDAVAMRSRYNQDMQWVLESRLGMIGKAAAMIKAAQASKRLNAMPAGTVLAYGLVAAAEHSMSEAQHALNVLRSKKRSGTSRLGATILEARFMEASGKAAEARNLYEQAAKLQDSLDFEAAQPWYFYPREMLAEMELRGGDAADAVMIAEAELLSHPNSVPALKLLEAGYSALGRMDDAQRVSRELQALVAPQ